MCRAGLAGPQVHMTADAATPSLPITPPSQLSSPGPLQASPSLSQDGSSNEQACPQVFQGPDAFRLRMCAPFFIFISFIFIFSLCFFKFNFSLGTGGARGLRSLLGPWSLYTCGSIAQPACIAVSNTRRSGQLSSQAAWAARAQATGAPAGP